MTDMHRMALNEEAGILGPDKVTLSYTTYIVSVIAELYATQDSC